ncbi:RNA polymerase sigma factor [Actinoplanes sp. CA-252034]|uniref:RNA polymerase sigma factor n=1 Tax=Actinoplanes sp. CA-252034 TaxID=3239906 RepID=UPI003D98F76B
MDPLIAAGVAARDWHGRLLALLAAGSGDIPAAEDALADAYEAAVRTWPEQGVPGNPGGWLLTVARNRIRDRWRAAEFRRTVALDVERDAPAHSDDVDVDAIPDRRLELMLVCAHPAIDRGMHTPLMLNTVLGFTAEQIGRAFSVPATTMATRLVRVKKRIRTTGIPFRIPERADLPGRMTAVLEAVYGAYALDPAEALHLVEVLATLAPDEPEVHGLAALVQLSAARAGARIGADGRFVPLDEQDPQQWDRGLIESAHGHLRAAHGLGRLGRFQVEAAIQALHCSGAADARTLLELHLILNDLAPSLGGGVALAAVTADVGGPAAGLTRLDDLLATAGEAGHRFQPARATRAHLLQRLGRHEEAAAEYDRAIALTADPAEREHLRDRRAAGGPEHGAEKRDGAARSA